jgi:hypothetical protein
MSPGGMASTDIDTIDATALRHTRAPETQGA